MVPIGEASRRSGVTIETIRYYEREGVVDKPGRSPAGRRLYTDDEIAQLRFVRRCRDLGFPMAIIQAFLSMSSDRDRSCDKVRSLADDHLVDIENKIENLIALRTVLRSLSRNCDAGTASCPMLDALMNDAAI